MLGNSFFLHWSLSKRIPSNYFRYLDDIISIVKRSLVNKLCDRLNSIHDNLQFTVEVEQHGRLPVMDVLLYREDNREIKVTIYRKPTHTDRYLPFSSHHPISMKESVMKSLVKRLNYVSEGATFEREMEIKHITGVLEKNGYPSSCLESWKRRSLESEGRSRTEKVNRK